MDGCVCVCVLFLCVFRVIRLSVCASAQNSVCVCVSCCWFRTRTVRRFPLSRGQYLPSLWCLVLFSMLFTHSSFPSSICCICISEKKYFLLAAVRVSWTLLVFCARGVVSGPTSMCVCQCGCTIFVERLSVLCDVIHRSSSRAF